MYLSEKDKKSLHLIEAKISKFHHKTQVSNLCVDICRNIDTLSYVPFFVNVWTSSCHQCSTRRTTKRSKLPGLDFIRLGSIKIWQFISIMFSDWRKTWKMNGVQREVDRMDGSMSIYITYCPTYILLLIYNFTILRRGNRRIQPTFVGIGKTMEEH